MEDRKRKRKDLHAPERTTKPATEERPREGEKGEEQVGHRDSKDKASPPTNGASFSITDLPDCIFEHLEVLAMPQGFLRRVLGHAMPALRVLITDSLPSKLPPTSELKELHIVKATSDLLASFQSTHPQVKVLRIDKTNPDPFTALSRGLPLDYAAEKASGQLASLSTLEPRGDPIRLCTDTDKALLERLREPACTKLFALNAARVDQLKKIKIALLDSGVNLAHPDLRIAMTRVFVDTESSCLDLSGHGTHCAGIIAGAHTGVAHGVQLYVGKIVDRLGNIRGEDVAKGVKWAIEHCVDIISLSLGARKYHHGLHPAIQAAIMQGIVVVCAAGNAGSTPVEHFYSRFPATIPGVICVGSVDAHGRASRFTSIGGAHIDAAGPGESILSNWITPEPSLSPPFSISRPPNDLYQFSDGTSMAAPFIAGVIALLLAYDRSLEIDGTPRPERLLNAHCVKDLLGRLCFNPSGDLGAGRGTLNLKNILDLPAQFDYLLDQIC